MTMTEAAKAGLIDRYSPDERAREERHRNDQEERLRTNRMEQAKRMAWAEVSRRNRIEVR